MDLDPTVVKQDVPCKSVSYAVYIISQLHRKFDCMFVFACQAMWNHIIITT